MLGEMAGHRDERAVLQTTFLASAGAVALRMLLPQLFVFNAATGAFEATPAVDLALGTGAVWRRDHPWGQPARLEADLPVMSEIMIPCVRMSSSLTGIPSQLQVSPNADAPVRPQSCFSSVLCMRGMRAFAATCDHACAA